MQLKDGAPAIESASIGAALCAAKGTEPATILDAADAAMYVTQKAGKGCVSYATEESGAGGESRARAG